MSCENNLDKLPTVVRDEGFYQTLRLLLELLHDPVLSRAAERMGLRTSTASRRLAKARTWFDDELFIYSAGQMFPTRRMQELEPQFTRLLDAFDELFLAAEPFNPETAEGVVRIVEVDNAFFLLLCPVISEMQKKIPGVKFHVYDRFPSMLESMRDGRIDMAIDSMEGKPVPAGFTELPLFHSDHVILTRRGHPLCTTARRSGGLKLADTLRYEHIGVAISMNADEHRMIIGRKLGLEDNIACEMPFFVAGATLCAETDFLMRTPRETALKLSKLLPVEVLESEEGVFIEWTPGLFWYRGTDTPLLTWVRTKIVVAAKRIHAAAHGGRGINRPA